MIKKNSIFDFLAHVMVIWGISMLALCLFTALFGTSAEGLSTMFELGNKGIPLETLMQFLLFSFLLTGIRWLFFTDVLFKQLSILNRSIFMFVCIIAGVAIFAAVFRWFPVNQILPWVLFFVSFGVCATVSVMVSVIKERHENRRMQQALERLKDEHQ